MEDTLHLKTSKRFKEAKQTSESQLIVDGFIKACLHLNASLFEPFMAEDRIFEDKEKYLFLAELHSIFKEIRRKAPDDFTVQIKDTFCKGCEIGKAVKHFIVNSRQLTDEAGHFAFLIEVQDGILIDIYRCYDYEGCKTYPFRLGPNVPPIEMSYDLVMKEFEKRRREKK